MASRIPCVVNYGNSPSTPWFREHYAGSAAKKMAPFPGPFRYISLHFMMVMAMTAMLDDHETLGVGAMPTTIMIALTDLNVYTATHFAALAAHFAPHALAALAASFHASLSAFATLFAHFSAAFRTAAVALDFATGGNAALIDADACSGFRSVLRQGRRCNCQHRSSGEQITKLGHCGFPLKS
jgi:hypothetical protein